MSAPLFMRSQSPGIGPRSWRIGITPLSISGRLDGHTVLPSLPLRRSRFGVRRVSAAFHALPKAQVVAGAVGVSMRPFSRRMRYYCCGCEVFQQMRSLESTGMESGADTPHSKAAAPQKDGNRAEGTERLRRGGAGRRGGEESCSVTQPRKRKAREGVPSRALPELFPTILLFLGEVGCHHVFQAELVDRALQCFCLLTDTLVLAFQSQLGQES